MKLAFIFLSYFIFPSIIIAAQKDILPRIQVNFSNWQNDTKQVVHLFSHQGSNFGEKNYLEAHECVHFEKLNPGQNAPSISIPFPFKKYLMGIRLVPEDNLRSCVQIYLNLIPMQRKFTLSIYAVANCMKSKTEEGGLSLAMKELEWDTENPPSGIMVDIQGTIGRRWDGAQATINPKVIS